MVKGLAFVIGLFISMFGTVGVLAPSSLTWTAQHFLTPDAFYAVAGIRITFGLVLIFAASTSRAPKVLRVLGVVIMIVGIATALTGLLGIGRAQASIEWWSHQGSAILRITGALLLVLGGFVAYACAPTGRAA